MELKQYLLLLKESAVRDTQVLSNYSASILDDETKQIWSDYNGSMLLTTVSVPHKKDLKATIDEVAKNHGVSKHSIEYIEVPLKATFGSYEQL